jgi:hypothetical protein
LPRQCPLVDAASAKVVAAETSTGGTSSSIPAAEDVNTGGFRLINHSVRIAAYRSPFAIGHNHCRAWKRDQVFGHGGSSWELTAVVKRLCGVTPKLTCKRVRQERAQRAFQKIARQVQRSLGAGPPGCLIYASGWWPRRGRARPLYETAAAGRPRRCVPRRGARSGEHWEASEQRIATTRLAGQRSHSRLR